MAITVSISDPALFQQAVPKPVLGTTPGGFISISGSNKKLKKLETGTGGRIINAWLDSMRASSPTRRSPSSSSENDQEHNNYYSNWIVSIHT